MNIHKLRDNLKNTIAGKEKMLGAYNAVLYKNFLEGDVLIATKATAEFLKVNINELRRILADVEVCCEQAVADSWRGADRQGGV